MSIVAYAGAPYSDCRLAGKVVLNRNRHWLDDDGEVQAEVTVAGVSDDTAPLLEVRPHFANPAGDEDYDCTSTTLSQGSDKRPNIHKTCARTTTSAVGRAGWVHVRARETLELPLAVSDVV